MENKYYTPELNEFCEGFRYEYNYNEQGWVNTIFTIGSGDIDCMAGEWYDFSPNNPRTKTRVKYLDKNDIESLGWNIYSNGDYWRGVYKQENTDFSKPQIVITGHTDNVYTIFGLTEEGGDIFNLFIGKIKNKSELKKLMKQLNII